MNQTFEKRGEAGFSLIEVLVAMTILAIGMMGVAGLQITAINGNSFSIKKTEASALAADKIEAYQNIAYADIPTGTETENGLGIFTRTTTVEKDVPVNNAKTITVNVTWADTVNRTLSFQTIISENG
jgi:type IV pilus assembly protein PilV